MGARVRTAGIGLGLILLGIAMYAGVERWMSTRIVRPVDMPISLAKGHTQTGPFRLNLKTDYWVLIDEGEWYKQGFACAEAYHNRLSRWTLYQNGRVIDQSDATRWATGFHVGPGIYELDFEAVTDGICMDGGHPRLSVSASTDTYDSIAFLLKAAAICVVFVGAILTAFLPVVRAVADRQRMERIGESATVGQDFQWARRRPLRRPITRLPNFGLFVGTFFALMVLIMMFLSDPTIPKGMWVRLLKPGKLAAKGDAWTEPLIVRVKDRGLGKEPAVFINEKPTAWDALSGGLKSELARRREWVVYVAGDDCVAYGNIAQVIDIARGEHAKVILLTEKHREQTCFPPAAVRGMTQ